MDRTLAAPRCDSSAKVNDLRRGQYMKNGIQFICNPLCSTFYSFPAVAMLIHSFAFSTARREPGAEVAAAHRVAELLCEDGCSEEQLRGCQRRQTPVP